METLFTKIGAYPWNADDNYPPRLSDVISMLSMNERRLLYWLAREFNLSENESIVDLGCFLGGSTVSLAAGLSQNPYVTNKKFRIHSYDIFLAPEDQVYLQYIGRGIRPGMSTLPFFVETMGEFADSVFVHAGDFAYAPPPLGDIGILFVDITKNWELNDRVIAEFFPKLIPGRSVVIQQDHNDHSCPWVNLAMAYFADYFDVLCDDHSSRVYAYKNKIPDSLLAIPLRQQIDADAMIALLYRATSISPNAHSRFFTYVTTAWIILEFKGIDAAMQHLDLCEARAGYPWETAGDYIAGVRSALKSVHEGSTRYRGMTFR